MNRGSKVRAQMSRLVAAGFNEAPIHESGKSPARYDPLAKPLRFNEAPIHESGKYPSPVLQESREPGFNEAPIHESGKSGHRRGCAVKPFRLQ